MSTPPTSRWRWWRIDAAALMLLASLTLGWHYGLIDPIVRQREDQTRTRSELAAASEQASQATVRLSRLKDQLEKVRQAVARSSIRLEPTSYLNQHVARLTQTAVEQGLTVEEVQPGAAASNQHFRTVPITLSGAGSYATCAQFLHAVNDAYPDTGVFGLEIVGTPDRANEPARFRFEFGWHAAPATPTTSPQAAAAVVAP